MTQKNLQSPFRSLIQNKRRGVAEVISTLLLVAITVVGAVILTTFIDESFVAGSLSVTSGTDTTIKTIKLIAYDTRNGDDLMDALYGIDNSAGPPSVLCRSTCDPNEAPAFGGSDFMVLQIENRSVNSIFLKNITLDGVIHTWDQGTASVLLDTSAADSSGNDYPGDGQFSILSVDPNDRVQKSRDVEGGQSVNLLIKLDSTNGNIELSKTMRVQMNIGESSLTDFLIETGDAR